MHRSSTDAAETVVLFLVVRPDNVLPGVSVGEAGEGALSAVPVKGEA